jgi:peroxiredoxin
MSLQKKLSAMKKRDSGILEQTVKVGDRAPDFSLTNADGQEFRLQELLSEGPIVLSFYRGKW